MQLVLPLERTGGIAKVADWVDSTDEMGRGDDTDEHDQRAKGGEMHIMEVVFLLRVAGESVR